MKRREFSARAATLLGASALPGLAWAQRKPEEGKDFRALDKKLPSDTPPGKIDVIEFFWYSCPHCNAFEPRLVTWIKNLPPDVVMKRVPVSFRDDFVPQQRLFYTLEALGKVDDLHAKVFEAVHAQKQPLAREDAIIDFLAKHGVDKAKAQETYNSFSVQTKARRATQVQDAYKVEGVPALGIAGRFYTDATMAGTMEKALQVTEYLLAEIRKGK